MKIVHTKAFVICAAKGGKKVPAPGVCEACDLPDQIRIGFAPNGPAFCFRCLRAAMVELAEATDVRMKITTDIDGVEHTTRVNMPEESR